jgi:hypothetical protein
MSFRIFSIFALFLAVLSGSHHGAHGANNVTAIVPLTSQGVSNGCVSFSVGPGTGCAWMCNYCASQLGTNNYYFTDNVCVYQTGGCTGNPVAGKQYTCCEVNGTQVPLKTLL